MRTIDQMIQQEVLACASFLVATLAGGWTGGERLHGWKPGEAFNRIKAVEDLAEQAFDLACPIDDWEEAGRQAGFMQTDSGITEPSDDDPDSWGSWREACEARGVDPYQWEIYEHWFVSDWLARKLEEQGEKVDRDFAGLNVWARTTTGQAIAMDGVIQRIYAAMMEA